MPKARPALQRGRAGAGDAVYFPAHRPARTRPARWPGCGPLRGGPEMPPTGAARTRCGFCHLPARYDGGPQMRITQVIRNFSTVSRLGRSPVQIAYNPPSVMRAGQEPAAIAAHQEQRAYMPAYRCGPRSWALPNIGPYRRSLRSAPPSAAGRSKRGLSGLAFTLPGVLTQARIFCVWGV